MQFCKSILFLSLLAALLASCSTDSSEYQVVENFITYCETAASDRKSRSLKQVISENYRDEQGRSKRDISAIISGYILRNKSIYTYSKIETVSIDEKKDVINATILVALAGRPIKEASFIVDLNADIYRFDIVLSKDTTSEGLFNFLKEEENSNPNLPIIVASQYMDENYSKKIKENRQSDVAGICIRIDYGYYCF